MPPRLPLGLAARCQNARAFTSSAALAQVGGGVKNPFDQLTGSLAQVSRPRAPAPDATVKQTDVEMLKLQMQYRHGDRYEPNSLSLKKSLAARKPRGDMFAHMTGGGLDAIDLVGIKKKDVLLEYKNFAFLADFTTGMGRIKHRDVTGLRPVNQRKVAKAIRRAVGLGLLPSTHRHPELLRLNESMYTRD